jgi:hypothetical protein
MRCINWQISEKGDNVAGVTQADTLDELVANLCEAVALAVTHRRYFMCAQVPYR